LLERTPKPVAAVVEPAEDAEADPAPASKGRGASSRVDTPRAAKPASKRQPGIKGRTVYIPDDLFERIIVQAHRKDRTISEYICGLLERHVPDHRVVRSGPAAERADAGETDAA